MMTNIIHKMLLNNHDIYILFMSSLLGGAACASVPHTLSPDESSARTQSARTHECQLAVYSLLVGY